MKNVDLQVSAGQRLVVLELDGVRLVVALVALLGDPGPVRSHAGRESSDVVVEHRYFRSAPFDPNGQLFGTAAVQHHSARVETAGVEQTCNATLRMGTVCQNFSNYQNCLVTKTGFKSYQNCFCKLLKLLSQITKTTFASCQNCFL